MRHRFRRVLLWLTISHQLDGQKAFMTGKLKTKGNMMLATKLNEVLKVRLYITFSTR